MIRGRKRRQIKCISWTSYLFLFFFFPSSLLLSLFCYHHQSFERSLLASHHFLTISLCVYFKERSTFFSLNSLPILFCKVKGKKRTKLYTLFIVFQASWGFFLCHVFLFFSQNNAFNFQVDFMAFLVSLSEIRMPSLCFHVFVEWMLFFCPWVLSGMR